MNSVTKKTISKIITYSLLILGSAFYILPFVWVLRSSLMRMDQIFTIPPILFPNPLKFGNYVEALTTVPFGRYYINTLTIVFFTVSGTVITSSLAAYGFSRIKWPHRDRIFAVLLTAMMLPFAVTLIPTFIGWKVLGGIDTYLPLTIPSWFGGGAYFIFLLRQFFKTIPKEYDEAAFVDGAGHGYIFLKIILPMVKSGLIVVGLFSFLGCWNDFLGPLVYINSETKYTVALGLQQFIGTYNAQWHLLMAASTVAILPAILVFFIGQRYLIEGINLVGIKA